MPAQLNRDAAHLDRDDAHRTLEAIDQAILVFGSAVDELKARARKIGVRTKDLEHLDGYVADAMVDLFFDCRREAEERIEAAARDLREG